MRESPSPTDLEPDDGACAAPAWHGDMLRELAELGMRMARAVTAGAEARAQAGEASAADEAAATLALQRAAKTVRLTVALDARLREPAAAKAVPQREQKLLDEAEQRRLAEAAEASADAVWVIRNLWKLVGRPMIQSSVELAIETEADEADRERMVAELYERLGEREEALIALGPGQYGDILGTFLMELGLSGRRLGSAFATALASRVERAVHDPKEWRSGLGTRAPP